MRRGGVPVVLAAMLAGCGGADPSSPRRPPDFAITLRHVDGSVPPPYHAEWRIAIDRSGTGRVAYVPDYPGRGAPTFRARFRPGDAGRSHVYALLRDGGLLAPPEGDEDPPVGGAYETATVIASRRTVEIPGSVAGKPSLESVARVLRRAVGPRIWRSLERRRAAYALRRYGRRP